MHKSDLIIQEPKKPFINKVIVSFLYACLISYTLYLLLYKDILNHPQKWLITGYLISLGGILFVISFQYIASHHIHLDFEQRKIQHRYKAGLFYYKEVWQDLIDLEYISVFKTGDYYQINLWYQKNQILNLMTLKDYKESIKNGHLIADQLNIYLLDASVKGNHRWVNKSIFKETRVIKHLE